MKYIEPSEKIVQQLPSREVLENYGRSLELLITAKDVPDLQFKLSETERSSKFKEESKNLLEGTQEVVEAMECNVLTKTIITTSKSHLKSSKIRESLGNSLKSAAGVALKTDRNRIQRRDQSGTKKQSKSCKHSEQSPHSAAGVALECTMPNGTLEVLGSMDHKEAANETSEYLENSHDSEAGVARPPVHEKSRGIYVEMNLFGKYSENCEESLDSQMLSCTGVQRNV